MRIIGVLSWYDEPPAWLATAVTGFGRICDTIVAVDGAYALYPKATARSHPRQAEAIALAAEASGIGCLIYQPRDVWHGNEIEKRNKALELAGTLAENGDWLCIFDADYHVQSCNPEVIRWELENTTHDVATYALAESIVEPKADWTVRTRDVYRWDPSLRIGPAHWHYSTDTAQLRGPEQVDGALDLPLVAYHRNGERAQARQTSKSRYHQLVEQLGIEAPEVISG